MSLNETYSTVRVGKNVSDRFPIRNGLKQGDALSPVPFDFALEYAIRRSQVNQGGLKLNGTHQLLAYADYVNLSDRFRIKNGLKQGDALSPMFCNFFSFCDRAKIPLFSNTNLLHYLFTDKTHAKIRTFSPLNSY